MKTLEDIKNEVADWLAEKTWSELMSYDYEYGVGLSKRYSLEQLMDKVSKHYANHKLDQAASKSIEMIWDRQDTQILESGSGLILRDFQVCYATAKQEILSLKDEI